MAKRSAVTGGGRRDAESPEAQSPRRPQRWWPHLLRCATQLSRALGTRVIWHKKKGFGDKTWALPRGARSRAPSFDKHSSTCPTHSHLAPQRERPRTPRLDTNSFEGNAVTLHAGTAGPVRSTADTENGAEGQAGAPGARRSRSDAGVHGRLLAGRLRRGRRRGFAGQWRWQVPLVRRRGRGRRGGHGVLFVQQVPIVG